MVVPVALDNVAAIQAAVDAVENDANVLNVVAAAVVAHDKLNAVRVAQQMVDPHFDCHQLKKLIE